jgi:hypothetical protein
MESLVHAAPRYRHVPGTAGRIIDGKAAIVTRDNRLHILNGVGTRIWELCERSSDRGAAEPELVEALVREFEVDEPTASRDCARFLEDLVSRGILAREKAASP